MANIDSWNIWGFHGVPELGVPKILSILIWCSITNNPFWGVYPHFRKPMEPPILKPPLSWFCCAAWVKLKPPTGSLSFVVFFVPGANYKDFPGMTTSWKNTRTLLYKLWRLQPPDIPSLSQSMGVVYEPDESFQRVKNPLPPAAYEQNWVETCKDFIII